MHNDDPVTVAPDLVFSRTHELFMGVVDILKGWVSGGYIEAEAARILLDVVHAHGDQRAAERMIEIAARMCDKCNGERPGYFQTPTVKDGGRSDILSDWEHVRDDSYSGALIFRALDCDAGGAWAGEALEDEKNT